jgi:hypothetical protein
MLLLCIIVLILDVAVAVPPPPSILIAPAPVCLAVLGVNDGDNDCIPSLIILSMKSSGCIFKVPGQTGGGATTTATIQTPCLLQPQWGW